MRMLVLLWLLWEVPLSAQYLPLTFTQVAVPILILPPPPVLVLPDLSGVPLLFELRPDGIRPLLVLPPLILPFAHPRAGPPARAWPLRKLEPRWTLR